MNLGSPAVALGATKAVKLRLLADWLDAVDHVHAKIAETFPAIVSAAPEMFMHADGDEVQRELREWANDLECGRLLTNAPKDPGSISRSG